jgi:hypothetical protein
MVNVQLLLLVAALVIAIVSGIGRAPLWPAVLLLCVAQLLIAGLGH